MHFVETDSGGKGVGYVRALEQGSSSSTPGGYGCGYERRACAAYPASAAARRVLAVLRSPVRMHEAKEAARTGVQFQSGDVYNNLGMRDAVCGLRPVQLGPLTSGIADNAQTVHGPKTLPRPCLAMPHPSRQAPGLGGPTCGKSAAPPCSMNSSFAFINFTFSGFCARGSCGSEI